MRKLIVSGVIIPLLVGFIGMSAYAQQNVPAAPCESPLTAAAPDEYQYEPPGELILVDTLLLRPLGIVALGVGLAGSLVSLPFAATSNSGCRVGRQLIKAPFDYTFKRPLGDMDY